MSVRLDQDVIRIEGDCPVEAAETLASLLDAVPDRAVDLGGAGSLHGAVLQTLLYYRPKLIGQPLDPFLADWILPALTARASK